MSRTAAKDGSARFFVTPHARARFHERVPDWPKGKDCAPTIVREVAQAFANQRVATRPPKWTTFTGTKGPKTGEGTKRWAWNRQETRAYLVGKKNHNPAGTDVHTPCWYVITCYQRRGVGG